MDSIAISNDWVKTYFMEKQFRIFISVFHFQIIGINWLLTDAGLCVLCAFEIILRTHKTAYWKLPHLLLINLSEFLCLLIVLKTSLKYIDEKFSANKSAIVSDPNHNCDVGYDGTAIPKT